MMKASFLILRIVRNLFNFSPKQITFSTKEINLYTYSQEENFFLKFKSTAFKNSNYSKWGTNMPYNS
jgi:hypothetical protein